MCGLVVVDGQHRAMSLIALYRNITSSWDQSGSRGNKYRRYYENIWPGEELNPESLSDISLPVTICIYPDLSEGNPITTQINFSQALRRNFTTLNLPAVPITRERKLLLSEVDLVSNCMRALTREMIDKSHSDTLRFEMYNIELDKAKDRNPINNKICSLGISSLHKICELMLYSEYGQYEDRLEDSSNYGKRILIEGVFASRLLLSDEWSDQDMPTSRNNFTKAQAQFIEEKFRSLYGSFAAKLLLCFRPLMIHHEACSQIEVDLSANSDVQSILFDGQGQLDVLRDFGKIIDKSKPFADPMRTAKFSEVKNKISKTTGEIEAYIANLSHYRAKAVLGEISAFSKSYVDSLSADELFSRFNFLWEEKYKSVAFQSALVMTLLIVVESFDRSEGVRLGDLMFPADTSGDPVVIADGLSLDDITADYLDAINSYFAPTTKSGLKKLLSLFKGEPDPKSFDLDDIRKWNFFKDGSGPRFSSVVTEKMDPKFWCSYRYILLEIYASNSKLMYSNSGVDNSELSALGGVVFEQIVALRKPLVNKVYKKLLEFYQDSGEHDPSEAPLLAVENTVRGVNKLLDNCSVAASRRVSREFVKEACHDARRSQVKDLDAPDDSSKSEDEDE